MLPYLSFLTLPPLFPNLAPLFPNLAPLFSNFADLFFLTLHLFFLILFAILPSRPGSRDGAQSKIKVRLAGSRRFWKVLDGSGRFGRFCAYLSYLLHLSYLSYLSDLSYLSYLSYLSNLPSPLTYIYPMFVSNFGILSYPIPPFPMQCFPIHPILPHLSYPIPSRLPIYLSI